MKVTVKKNERVANMIFAEFSYYAYDSGHVRNIVNDCLIAIEEDGV